MAIAEKAAPAKALQINKDLFEKSALVFRAINNELRQEMLSFMHKQGRVTVTELYVRLRLEQSIASQHLRIFREADLVIADRVGKQVFYSVNYQRLEELTQLAGQIVNKDKSSY